MLFRHLFRNLKSRARHGRPAAARRRPDHELSLEVLEDRIVPSLAATPWPMVGQNLQHTGQSPYTGSTTGAAAWVGGGHHGDKRGRGTNTIYTTDNGLLALTLGGSLRWKFRAAIANSTPAVSSDG